MKTTATTWLSREEIRALMTPSDLRGWLSLATTWGLIALAFVVLLFAGGHPLAWVVSVVILGGRQLALAILMHECSHGSLFATRALNEHVGKWLIAAPMWQRLGDYRRHHLMHHAHTSLEGDPDLGLVTPFPTTRWSLARKLLRDVTGLAFLRRTAAQLLMDAGVLTYSASTGQQRVVPRPSAAIMLRGLVVNTGPMLLTNFALWGGLAALGHGWLYLAWVLANATTFSLFLRIRSIAEHAVTEASDDPLRHTRTTEAGLLARLTVAPHHVNYHLEHHLLPTVPHYRLKRLHQLLWERGASAGATYARGYLEVLRLASSG
ncbi:MAG: fatty acid desaturase family protein [Archangium sp.]|nr:fatty acid desaturase family protein [Archangium sp.]